MISAIEHMDTTLSGARPGWWRKEAPGSRSIPRNFLDLQDAWQLYGVTRGGVEARRARTDCELVLAGGDTDLRVFDAWTGYWVAEWRWGRLRWLACWFTALLRCVCAAADGGEHTPRVVAPAPVITAGRLFQRARLRNNHGANSAYLSRWPS